MSHPTMEKSMVFVSVFEIKSTTDVCLEFVFILSHSCPSQYAVHYLLSDVMVK